MLPKVFVLIGLPCAVLGLWLWWSFGPPLSAETSYNLAVEPAQKYAAREHIDLSKYNAPILGSRPKSRVYFFEWTPKDDDGKPFTAGVDAQIVEVYVIELPIESLR
jgi:hypothetical protein